MTIYNPFVAEDQADGSFDVFRPYLERINTHISIVAVANGAAYAQVYRAFNGPDGSEDPDAKDYLWFDGLHPGEDGHSVMAERLGDLDYARSSEPANTAFERTWARTDAPVAANAVNRTWMWGVPAYSAVMHEEYADSPDGQRIVQYFDKSRMEINDPDGDQSSPWYVSNGLLVVELVSGQMQVGEGAFINRSPAQLNVAGDPDDVTGPTYAIMGSLRDQSPLADAATIVQRIDAEGVVIQDPSLARYDVTAAERVIVTGIDHQVASVFWEFMQSSGPVLVGDEVIEERLFEDPFYATGLPIAEAYWAEVAVGGTPREVLIQCFERRCLTYTPDNPDGWKVEAGNVGQHYFVWRYGHIVQR